MSQKRSQPCHPFYLGQKRMSNSCRGSQYHPDRNRPVWRKSRIRDNSVEKQTEHVRQQYISLDRPLCYTCSHHQRVGNFHPLQVPELGHTIQTLLHLFCRRRADCTPLMLALPCCWHSLRPLRRISMPDSPHYSVSCSCFSRTD